MQETQIKPCELVTNEIIALLREGGLAKRWTRMEGVYGLVTALASMMICDECLEGREVEMFRPVWEKLMKAVHEIYHAECAPAVKDQ